MKETAVHVNECLARPKCTPGRDRLWTVFQSREHVHTSALQARFSDSRPIPGRLPTRSRRTVASCPGNSRMQPGRTLTAARPSRIFTAFPFRSSMQALARKDLKRKQHAKEHFYYRTNAVKCKQERCTGHWRPSDWLRMGRVESPWPGPVRRTIDVGASGDILEPAFRCRYFVSGTYEPAFTALGACERRGDGDWDAWRRRRGPGTLIRTEFGRRHVLLPALWISRY